MSQSPCAIARACLQAYVDKDRAALEALLDEDFHFTSPIDKGIGEHDDRERIHRIHEPVMTVDASPRPRACTLRRLRGHRVLQHRNAETESPSRTQQRRQITGDVGRHRANRLGTQDALTSATQRFEENENVGSSARHAGTARRVRGRIENT
jgi:hypothetical protein